MNPFISRCIDGTYFCHGCNLSITGHKDTETHAIYVHRIPLDFLAQDDRGDFFDLRGMDLPQVLREGGAI